MTAARGGSALIRTIVELGKNMGLQVVAEGVETDEQLQLIQASGCDLIQGYLLCGPKPARDIRSLMADARQAVAE